MPRVHERKAAKDYPDHGIIKGEKYFTWKKKTGPVSGITYKSKQYPSRSQLTTSAFLAAVYDVSDLSIPSAEDPDSLRAVAQEIRDLGEEEQSKLESMPENLQQGSTGELLQERADGCESWADEIEAAADQWESAVADAQREQEDLEEEEEVEEEEEADLVAEAADEARATASEGCPF